jgi:hypothetical protein
LLIGIFGYYRLRTSQSPREIGLRNINNQTGRDTGAMTKIETGTSSTGRRAIAIDQGRTLVASKRGSSRRST